MTQIWYILLISKIITYFINVKKVRQRFQILHDTHKNRSTGSREHIFKNSILDFFDKYKTPNNLLGKCVPNTKKEEN